MPIAEQIQLRLESTCTTNKVETNYLLKLPEYKTEIIIREAYIDELIKKLTILKSTQNEQH